MNEKTTALIQSLPLDNITTIKAVTYDVPQCARQAICGTVKDGDQTRQYAGYVTPSGIRFVWIDELGIFKLNNTEAWK
jgi:hypothetical protein